MCCDTHHRLLIRRKQSPCIRVYRPILYSNLAQLEDERDALHTVTACHRHHGTVLASTVTGVTSCSLTRTITDNSQLEHLHPI